MSKYFIGCVGLLVSMCVGGLFGYWKSFQIASRIINKKEKERDKLLNYFELFDQWMYLRENGISLAEYFYKKKYYKIAIYGVGKICTHLQKELEGSDVQIMYGIDQNAKLEDSQIKVYSLHDKLPDADAIVVTPTFAYESIAKALKEKTEIAIVSIDDIIYELI